MVVSFIIYSEMIAYGVWNKTKVSDCRYVLGVKGQDHAYIVLETHLQIVMRIPLSFIDRRCQYLAQLEF